MSTVWDSPILVVGIIAVLAVVAVHAAVRTGRDAKRKHHRER